MGDNLFEGVSPLSAALLRFRHPVRPLKLRRSDCTGSLPDLPLEAVPVPEDVAF